MALLTTGGGGDGGDHRCVMHRYTSLALARVLLLLLRVLLECHAFSTGLEEAPSSSTHQQDIDSDHHPLMIIDQPIAHPQYTTRIHTNIYTYNGQSTAVGGVAGLGAAAVLSARRSTTRSAGTRNALQAHEEVVRIRCPELPLAGGCR